MYTCAKVTYRFQILEVSTRKVIRKMKIALSNKRKGVFRIITAKFLTDRILNQNVKYKYCKCMNKVFFSLNDTVYISWNDLDHLELRNNKQIERITRIDCWLLTSSGKYYMQFQDGYENPKQGIIFNQNIIRLQEIKRITK